MFHIFYVLLILGWGDRKIACITLKCGKSAGFCIVLGGFFMVRKSAHFFAFFGIFLQN